MYLKKIITVDFLLLAFTVAIEKVYLAFLNKYFTKAFTHDHPYTANPYFWLCSCSCFLSDGSYNKEELVSTIKSFYKHLACTCTGFIAAFDVHGS